MKSSEKEFIAEAEEILEESGRHLLEIQDTYIQGADPDTVNALFRSLHTLKGLAGLFGHASINEISHALESILDDIRLGKSEINDGLIRFLFKYVDLLKSIIEGMKDGTEPDVTDNIKEIETFRKSLKAGGEAQDLHGIVDKSILKVLSEYEEHRLKANVKDGKGVYFIRSVLKLSDFDKHLENITKNIKKSGELIATLPTSLDVPPDSIGFNLLVASAKTLSEIKDSVQLPVDEVLAARDSGVSAAPAAGAKEQTLKTTSTTVRVDIEKLDRILNTIGELTLSKGAVVRISSEITDRYGHNPLMVDLHKIAQVLERRLVELQDQVLEIRMVPIGQIFGRLSQVIRRYSRDAGKKIDLQMYGGETEIDKFLAEEVVDPLVHVVRNAIDHGIEDASERRLKGKDPVAVVTLKAYQRGNHVVIEVKDDGKGIDVEKVKSKAIEKGLVDPSMELTRRDILDLIFMPGFSTKDTISDISGRGVGLDIVKDKLSTMGGFAEVETETDVGTSFTLTIPITLAIIKSLIVRVGQEQYAVPLSTISETLSVDYAALKFIEGREVFNLRGEMLSMAKVSDVFGTEGCKSEHLFAVVVGYGERKMGFLVDELYGQQEVVIKSLGDYFKGLRGFAGAAEIGKHEVILVIDVEAAIDESQSRQRGAVNV